MKKLTRPTGKPKPLSTTQACNVFKATCGLGSIIWGPHAPKKMKEHGFDANDVLALGKPGFVFNPPEPHIRTGAWTYRIEHPGEALKVVFEVISKKPAKGKTHYRYWKVV